MPLKKKNKKQAPIWRPGVLEIPFLFTSGESLYKGMENSVQNEEENQPYVSHRQQTSQRTVILKAL